MQHAFTEIQKNHSESKLQNFIQKYVTVFHLDNFIETV